MAALATKQQSIKIFDKLKAKSANKAWIPTCCMESREAAG